ncbi:MAG: glycine zipper 2TM domain-containing protein [Sphingobium sp.]
MKKLLVTAAASLSLGAVTIATTATPAMADPPRHAQDRGKGHWKGNGNGHWKHGDDRRYSDRRYYDRRDVRVVHVYDYNRPDPRYRGYYANRYYAGGYAPIRVSRATRLYRGDNGRYYCRRSDGTTGLIIGAAVGGLLGNRLAQGQSTTVATIIGAGAGALLGRAIDRGEVTCR